MPARSDVPRRAALPILWAFGVAASVFLSAGCGEDGPIPPNPPEGGAAGVAGAGGAVGGAGGAVGGAGGGTSGGAGGAGGMPMGGAGGAGGMAMGGAGGTGGIAMGGAGGAGGTMAQIVPDFSLIDVNPNSMTSGQPVSPRDYLMRVSAWYFGHST